MYVTHNDLICISCDCSMQSEPRCVWLYQSKSFIILKTITKFHLYCRKYPISHHWIIPILIFSGEMAALPPGTGWTKFLGFFVVFFFKAEEMCGVKNVICSLQSWPVGKQRWFWCSLSPLSKTSTWLNSSSTAPPVQSATTTHTWQPASLWTAAALRPW